MASFSLPVLPPPKCHKAFTTHLQRAELRVCSTDASATGGNLRACADGHARARVLSIRRGDALRQSNVTRKVTRWRMCVHWYCNERVHHRLPRQPCAGEINTSQAWWQGKRWAQGDISSRREEEAEKLLSQGALRQGEWKINWENEHTDNDNRERQPCPLLSDNEPSVWQKGEKNTCGQVGRAIWWGD